MVATIRLDPIWDQLFPAEQQRIVRFLVKRVIVSPRDIEKPKGGLAAFSRNPPSGKPAYEPDFSPCLITFARMFPVVRIFHGGIAGTPPSLADRKHPSLTRSLRFRTRSTTVPDRCHRHTPRSPPSPLDVTTERFGFFNPLALYQVVIRLRHRAGRAVINPKANETRTQRRFWEHAIQDQRDYDARLDYIHFNPVKHGWVARVADWPHSSFHRFVRLGLYPQRIVRRSRHHRFRVVPEHNEPISCRVRCAHTERGVILARCRGIGGNVFLHLQHLSPAGTGARWWACRRGSMTRWSACAQRTLHFDTMALFATARGPDNG